MSEKYTEFEGRFPIQLVKTFSKGEWVVGMVIFENQLFVATNERVYMFKGDKLESIEMKNDPESAKP